VTAVEPAPGYCTLSVEGVVNQVVRSINATIRLDGQSNLVEHFPSLADYSANWTTTSTNGLGAVGWGADNCPIAICTTSNPASGSLVFETNVASDAAIFQAGVKRALTNPFETGPAGMSGAINIAIKKDVLKATALTNEVYIYLTDSAGGFADLIFTDLRRTTPSKRWEYINQVLTFPANRTYDGISIVVNLAENATPRNNSVLAQIDVLEILGTSGTGGALILDWSE
ncbi:MAG: hypothetical protein OEZ47_16330, partial [Gammaproteobacteria bacterium]|nr:hypothetical protein [Gammaproteobacteria bacterium]